VQQDDKRNLLAIFPKLTDDLAKSAHMLAMKHMADFGWKATVITITGADEQTTVDWWHGVQITRFFPRSLRWRMARRLSQIRKTDHKGKARRALSRSLLPVAATISFPDAYAAASPEILHLADRLHHEQAFDVVLSLYHPLSAHSVARRFAKKHRVPWIALTKDFYSWPDELLGSRLGRVCNTLKRRKESRFLRGSAALLTVSDYMTDYLRQVMPDLTVDALPHCYDPDAFQDGSTERDGEGVFRLVSVGRTLREHDCIGLSTLFRVLRELHREGTIHPEQFRVRFVGRGEALVREHARKHECEKFLEIVPPVVHSEAMRSLSNATCLFYIQTPFGSRRRLAEYLGSRRPILAFPEYAGTMADRLIRSYGAGKVATDKDSLKANLQELYRLYQANGSLELPVNKDVVNGQSASRRAREFASLLDRMVVGNTKDRRVSLDDAAAADDVTVAFGDEPP